MSSKSGTLTLTRRMGRLDKHRQVVRQVNQFVAQSTDKHN